MQILFGIMFKCIIRIIRILHNRIILLILFIHKLIYWTNHKMRLKMIKWLNKASGICVNSLNFTQIVALTPCLFKGV